MAYRNYSEEDLIEQAAFEFDLDGNGVHPVAFSSAKLWMLVGQLQLALRHPENIGEPAAFSRSFIESIAEDIAPEGSARAEMLRRGWPENQRED